MYENLLHQKAVSLLKSDIKNSSFPGAVLFSGSQGSGKLTCALETGRILSCTQNPKARWDCTCQSCLKNKAMTSNNILLLGPRDCTPEIKASLATFLKAQKENVRYKDATRYLFIRSIRKLTLRFSQILWENDDKLNKIAQITSAINEELETLDFPHELPDFPEIEKTSGKLVELSEELETSFLYDSIPVNQIRNVSYWARLKSVEGKNTVIIENAERMLESVRNALLKILEEPPEGTCFILTTSRKNLVMPTILSRVRVYPFSERTIQEQNDIIKKVYHNDEFSGSIEDYLNLYLPVKPDEIRGKAVSFVEEIAEGHIPNISLLVKDLKNFEPRSMFKIFLNGINQFARKLILSPKGESAADEVNKALLSCYSNVTVYNQSIQASLEILLRELSKINRTNGNILKCAIM